MCPTEERIERISLRKPEQCIVCLDPDHLFELYCFDLGQYISQTLHEPEKGAAGHKLPRPKGRGNSPGG
jgi:hypothetical protein